MTEREPEQPAELRGLGSTAWNVGRLGEWLDDRAGLGAMRELADKKTVPLHRPTVWYYFGGTTLFPWELGEKADPFAPAFADIKPGWFFMFMFQTPEIVPAGAVLGIENEAVAILGFGLMGLLALRVPFIDLNASRSERSPIFALAGGGRHGGVVGGASPSHRGGRSTPRPAARAEWRFRRQGLAVSLVLIVLVLVGLWLKIRELDRRRRQAHAHGP